LNGATYHNKQRSAKYGRDKISDQPQTVTTTSDRPNTVHQLSAKTATTSGDQPNTAYQLPSKTATTPCDQPNSAYQPPAKTGTTTCDHLNTSYQLSAIIGGEDNQLSASNGNNNLRSTIDSHLLALQTPFLSFDSKKTTNSQKKLTIFRIF
jgi:hypothetical protein